MIPNCDINIVQYAVFYQHFHTILVAQGHLVAWSLTVAQYTERQLVTKQQLKHHLLCLWNQIITIFVALEIEWFHLPA